MVHCRKEPVLSCHRFAALTTKYRYTQLVHFILKPFPSARHKNGFDWLMSRRIFHSIKREILIT